MNKFELLEAVRSARRLWDELLASIGTEQMVQAGAVGQWSVKDTISHISWFEREMAELLETRALVGSDLWNLPADERNDAIYQQFHGQSIEQAAADSTASFNRLVLAIESLRVDEVTDPRRYQNMPPDWVPWQIVAQNSYEHYQHHVTDIRAWLSDN